jgi:prepilin-type N-terminal cleavage/methylation domain-containing protein
MHTPQGAPRHAAVYLRGSARNRATGFTLVEILIVLAIICILVGLIGVAASSALSKSSRSKVVVEINQLSAKMEEYKGGVGAYPPNCGVNINPLVRRTQIMAHLRKAFPRFPPAMGMDAGYTNTRTGIANAYNYFDAAGVVQPLDLDNLDQAESLVFWLGGLPTPLDMSLAPPQPMIGKRLYGFSSNASNPFALAGERNPGLFEFVETRLQDADNDGWPEYVPDFRGATLGGRPPYVYFDPASYPTASLPTNPIYPGALPLSPVGYISQWGIAGPYYDSAKPLPGTCVNAVTFQIVCAGQDLQYGDVVFPNVGKFFPSGQNYSEFDSDNLTNFTIGRLQDAQP